MTEKLDFSIPGRETKNSGGKSRALLFLMIAVLIALAANIYIVLTQSGQIPGKPDSPILSPDLQKQVALKLEKQGLNNVAIQAWKEYLLIASPDSEEIAKIWYRIGRLHQDENNYASALDSYYRSESFGLPGEVSSDIARNIRECLESMGKFTALRYELADRVGVDTVTGVKEAGARGDRVMAEIGALKITGSDLDRILESQIDRQTSQLSSYLPEEEIKKQKEDFLKQFSSPSRRIMFLNQFIFEELLYRRAGELRLADDPRVHSLLRDQERGILAKMAMEKELAEKIQITPGDLDIYYKAHKSEYIRPERAKISYISASNEGEAGKLRKKLKKGADFNDLATGISEDDSTPGKKEKVSGWIEKNDGAYVSGVGYSKDAMEAIFSTDAGEIVKEDITTDDGLYIIKVVDREPERQKAFDEVEDQVFSELRAQKEKEVHQYLLADLKRKYNVVIHQ
ncbi:MAG: hypothetical protein GY864_06820 [Desulfobacterales bacterium]|nr:hypothetical protein [Desulfobacterales bacterium]